MTLADSLAPAARITVSKFSPRRAISSFSSTVGSRVAASGVFGWLVTFSGTTRTSIPEKRVSVAGA